MSARAAEQPAVSIVICTYNRADRVPDAIRACLTQTFPDLEVVVVDDGSSDGTDEVVARLAEPRLRYLRIENRGLSGARNVGIHAARAPVVTFLDDDDVPDPDWIESLVAAGQGSAVACGGLRFVSPTGEPMGVELPHRLGPEYFGRTALFRAGSFAVDRELLLAVGGFDRRARCSEHTELSIRLLAELERTGGAIAVVSRPLVTVERRPTSERKEFRPEIKLATTTFMLERHAEHFARRPEAAATYWAIAGVSAAQLGDLPSARQYFVRSFRVAPSARALVRVVVASVEPLATRKWGPIAA